MDRHNNERQHEIAENIRSVQSKISKAAERSGRRADDITLVCVTKSRPESDIEAAINCGLHDIGENRVQEFTKKYDYFFSENREKMPRFHLIGHLQTNKVKYIIDKSALIHSVDSLKLAAEISRQAISPVKILLEVNMEAEASKFGFAPSDAINAAKQVAGMKNIVVAGLMTVAPNVEIAEENRTCFRKMRELYIDIKEALGNDNGMRFLSMGMTNDYEVAIEEGSNLVRIGTGIFTLRSTI